MKTRFPVIPVLAVLILIACGSPRKLRGPFEVWERTIITMSDSVMYVFVKSEFMDSIELRAHCRDLSNEELQSDLLPMLAAKMRATLRSPQQGGVGLAAPQVGIHRRIVAIQRLDKPGEPVEVYSNLHVLAHLGDTVRGPEGCLSIPGKRGIVPRREGVVISWKDPQTLETRQEEIHGFTAIIFQHEIDHLDGILYTDRADTVFVNQAWLDERAPYEAEGAYEKPQWLYGPGV
jgi:peptide deformylase